MAVPFAELHGKALACRDTISPRMAERILSVVMVAGWALLGSMTTLDSGQPIWWGALVGGLFAGLLVGVYWADRWEREAAGRTCSDAARRDGRLGGPCGFVDESLGEPATPND